MLSKTDKLMLVTMFRILLVFLMGVVGTKFSNSVAETMKEDLALIREWAEFPYDLA